MADSLEAFISEHMDKLSPEEAQEFAEIRVEGELSDDDVEDVAGGIVARRPKNCKTKYINGKRITSCIWVKV